MAFAITEPDAGSNTHRLSTTATRDGELYRLRGTKTYISGVDEAARMVVVARTGTDEETGEARLSIFVVDTDAPGLERTLIPVEIGAPEKQFQLFFDDVEVGADRLLGTEGDGLRQVFFGLNPERITGASICHRDRPVRARRAASYASERSVWDVPIGTHQGIAHPLAVAKIELELARLMMMKAAWLHDHGRRRGRGGRGREHGQVRGRGGGAALPRRRHPDPRRQRDGLGVRPRRPLGAPAAAAHRAGQPGDGAQLRRPAVARASPSRTDGDDTVSIAVTPRGRLRTERLLDATAALVAERGFHAVGIADIGAAAGVSGSAIYRHFRSKQEILVALLDRVVDGLLDGRAADRGRRHRSPRGARRARPRATSSSRSRDRADHRGVLAGGEPPP